MPSRTNQQESPYAALIAADYMDQFPADIEADQTLEQFLSAVMVYTFAWLDGYGRGRFGDRSKIVGVDVEITDIPQLVQDVTAKVQAARARSDA